MMTLLAVVTLLIVLVLVGIPIYVALGGTALMLFLVSGVSIGGLAQVVLDHLDSSSLIAIPYFVMATTFLEHGRAGRVLVELADIWLGWVKGGLGLACVFAALVFSAISGSSTATVLALGVILIPAMTERSYPREFCPRSSRCFRYARNSYPPQYCANCVRICDRVVRAKAVLSRCSARSNTSRIIFLVGNIFWPSA